jgi:type II secretory pathway pseudopilin PulG
MTKKAFTVMEIIFVIVVLGILTTVIIPRLMTSRDDAKVAFCTQNITLFIRDISSYYSSQGKYSLDMSEMTNTIVHEIEPITSMGDRGEYYYVCNKTKENISLNDAAVTFKFSKISNNDGSMTTNLNINTTSVLQGSVDGDLGHLLKLKNIATDGVGINHKLVGMRVKR